jgi:hypothetical protein
VAVLIAAQQAGAPLWVVNVAILLPGVVTAVFRRASRRRWYRWLVIFALAQVVNPWATAPFLLVATSWALWRSWFVERIDPTTTTRVGPVTNSRAAVPRSAGHPSVKRPHDHLTTATR